MSIKKNMKVKTLKGASSKLVANIIKMALKNSGTRKVIIKTVEKYYLVFKDPARPERIEEDRNAMVRALLYSLDRILSHKGISKNAMERLIDIFFLKVFVKDPRPREKYNRAFGFPPPAFVTISPTNVCNLKCKGCYAGEIYKGTTMEYEIFDRIITDMKNEFGSHFTVISGGEPFSYNDRGRTLIDILKKHRDNYFLVYTNGTLIDEKMAKQLGELGNIAPAISVEGFEKETDWRRGEGVWKKIMNAMDNLKKYGVPFGISVTPTRNNYQLLLSDEFFNFFFKEKGAFFGWYFQYMPIGRKPSMDLMITPEQRVAMYKRMWQKVREDKLFIADFWNSGTTSDGCMAGASQKGYFYIMWDGTVTPCVFVPFTDKNYGNIFEVYKRGETLTDLVTKSAFFSAIREWQYSYFSIEDWREKKYGNLMTPCFIRDNSSTFYEIVKMVEAKPVDEGAKEYLSLVEKGDMPEYNRKLKELTDPVWEKEYLRKNLVNELSKN